MALDKAGPASKKTGLTELRNRILFVLGAILVFRIGAHVPVPGIDPVRLADFFAQQGNTIFGLFNMFSGGALQRFTVFALGIMPYISASIIIQLLTLVSPTLETLKKEGWFDDDQVLDVILNDDELRRLRNKEQITVSQLGSSYTIVLRPEANLKALTPPDMIIKKIRSNQDF